MQAGDIVKLKPDFEQELEKLGFCGHHAHAVSMGFNNGLLKIAYIRHDHELDIDFAVFSPFFKVPMQCLELASGEDLLRDYKKIKPKGLKDFLEEDKSLTTPMTYKEFINSVQSGFDDSGIEEAYEAYKRVLESQNSV